MCLNAPILGPCVREILKGNNKRYWKCYTHAVWVRCGRELKRTLTAVSVLSQSQWHWEIELKFRNGLNFNYFCVHPDQLEKWGMLCPDPSWVLPHRWQFSREPLTSGVGHLFSLPAAVCAAFKCLPRLGFRKGIKTNLCALLWGNCGM